MQDRADSNALSPAILVSPVVYVVLSALCMGGCAVHILQGVLLNQAAERAAAPGVDTSDLAPAGLIVAAQVGMLAASVLMMLVGSVFVCRGHDMPLWLGSALLVAEVLGFSLANVLRRTQAVGIVCFNLGGVLHNIGVLSCSAYLAAIVGHVTRSPPAVILVAVVCGLLSSNGTYSPLVFEAISGSAFFREALA